MVEHAVQDNADPALMGLLHQRAEELIRRLQVLFFSNPADIAGCLRVIIFPLVQDLSLVNDQLPEMRIDMVIILGVVFVIGGRHEQRVEIDRLYPQILQVVQLLPHALQVAAVEIAHVHALRPLIPVFDLPDMLPDIGILIIKHIVGRIAVKKPVRIDLVHDGALRPGGRGESGTDPEGPDVLPPADDAVLAQSLTGAPADDHKIIAQDVSSHLDLRRIVVKDSLAFFKIQPLAKMLAYQPDLIHIGFGGPHAEGHDISDLGFRGKHIVAALIRKQRFPVQRGDHLHHIAGGPHRLAADLSVVWCIHSDYPYFRDSGLLALNPYI